jgi:hypothetical protein
MKEFKINPLDVLEKRRFHFLPPHLSPIGLGSVGIRTVNEWITNTLSGRYFIGPMLRLENNRLMSQDVVAFEDPKESTIFLLACPHLAKNKV